MPALTGWSLLKNMLLIALRPTQKLVERKWAVREQAEMEAMQKNFCFKVMQFNTLADGETKHLVLDNRQDIILFILSSIGPLYFH